MTRTTVIQFSDIVVPDKGDLVVICEQGPKLGPQAKLLDKQLGGAIKKAVNLTGFKGKRKTSVELLAPSGTGLSRIRLVGSGDPKSESEEDWLNLGGYIRAGLNTKIDSGPTIIAERSVAGREIAPELIDKLACGLILRGYNFKKYKSGINGNDKTFDEKNSIKKILIQCNDPKTSRKIHKAGKALCDGIILARDLMNEPANILGPEEFAERAKSLTNVGIKVKVLGEREMEKLGMNALLGVGLGSVKPSKLAVMQWNGARDSKASPVAFVGKGVTFDTGGISIKPAGGMEDMKGDMGGAACVVGLMHVLGARKAKVNAVGVIGLVENMPGGAAQRPGDIVKSMSGKTIEVLNTDAEGRLVLADALWYTQEKFKPVFMINLATLTGAVMVALGKEYAGMFSNNDELAERLYKAGCATGEKIWRLPLGDAYDKLIDSKTADMKNLGGRWGGAITAAQFLQRFVNDVPWAHIDIAGTAMASPKTAINQSWGSGYGVSLLNRLVLESYES